MQSQFLLVIYDLQTQKRKERELEINLSQTKNQKDIFIVISEKNHFNK